MERKNEAVVAADRIWLIGSPMVFALGLVGNILIVVVLMSNPKTSSTIYLTYLAVFDLLQITNMVPRWWIIYMYGVDIRHLNEAVCKITLYLVEFTARASNACLVAITIERVIATVRPQPIHTLCTQKVAIAVLSAITVFFGLFYVYHLYGYTILKTQIISGNITGDEMVNHGQGVFSTTGLPLNNSFAGFGLSSVETNGMNQSYLDVSTATMKMPTTTLAFDDYTYEPTSSYSMVPISTRSNVVTLTSCGVRSDVPSFSAFFIVMEPVAIFGLVIGAHAILLIAAIFIVWKLSSVKSKSGKSSSKSRISQVTITVLVVNILQFVLHFPLYIFYVFRRSIVDPVTGMTATQEILWAVLSMMYNLNYAINFYVYVLMGARFRQQFVDLIMCKRGNQKSVK